MNHQQHRQYIRHISQLHHHHTHFRILHHRHHHRSHHHLQILSLCPPIYHIVLHDNNAICHLSTTIKQPAILQNHLFCKLKKQSKIFQRKKKNERDEKKKRKLKMAVFSFFIHIVLTVFLSLYNSELKCTTLERQKISIKI